MSKLHVQLIIGFCISLLGIPSCERVFAKGEPVECVEFQRQVPLVIAQETIVSKIKINGQKGLRLQEIGLRLSGSATATSKIKVSIYHAKSDSVFKNTPAQEWSLFASKEMEYNTSEIFTGDMALNGEESYFYVSCTLPETWKLEDKFTLTTTQVLTAGKIYKPKIADAKTFYPAVSVRRHKQDGVHTSRIPGLATTNKGTLIAVFDARYESGRDLQGHMDIGIHRSEDGGKSWEPMQIVLDKGEWGGLPQKFNGVSDAGILVDKQSGTIYIAGLWMHGLLDEEGKWIENLTEDSDVWDHQWRNKASQPGYDVRQTSQFLIVKSTDDGKTWSEPINITTQGKKEDWWLWAPAPGQGITLKDGTLVFPTQGRDENGFPFSNITYSQDGGETWISTNPAVQESTTECTVVELSDGSLMLNMRADDNRGDTTLTNGRAVAVTNDLGQTWAIHPTSHKALPEPVCMASMIRHDQNSGTSFLLFSNPDSKTKRHRLSIKISDDGRHWDHYPALLLDEWNSRGYSSLTSVDNNYIGILYESSQADMVFQKIAIAEIISGTAKN